MRTYTLACSIVVHALIVSGFVLTPIVATDELPAPRRAFDYIVVQPIAPPDIPVVPAGKPRSSNGGSFSAHAAPVSAPNQIVRDSGIDCLEPTGTGEGVPYGLPGDPNDALGSEVEAPPPPPPAPPVDRTPVRVGGTIREPQKIRNVAPVYPSIALAAGIQGTVILETVIDEDGRVRSLRVLRSVAMLDQAALDAVRQWQFTPTLLNGQPVRVLMTVTVSFDLK